MITKLTELTKAFVITTRCFFKENYLLYVSALTFTTLLSLVPIFSIIVFIMTKLTAFSSLVILSENYLVKYLMPAAVGSVQSYLQNFIHQALRLPTFSIVFLFITAVLFINTIDDTINDIWKIPRKTKRIFIWFFYAIILLTSPVILGSSIFLLSYLFSFAFFSKFTSIIVFLLPILLNTIIFTLFYICTPRVKVSKLDALFVGFFVALLLDLTRIGFALWIVYFSTYEKIYGVFAILPIFLLWLYICWFIIIWGVVFMRTLYLKTHKSH